MVSSDFRVAVVLCSEIDAPVAAVASVADGGRMEVGGADKVEVMDGTVPASSVEEEAEDDPVMEVALSGCVEVTVCGLSVWVAG